jgi:hypothetical protein
MLACAAPSPRDAGGSAPAEPLVVSTQNAGTTPDMDAIEASPHRAVCEAWYDNNLCLADTEDLLADALQHVDIALLEEMWDAPWCDDPDRPARRWRRRVPAAAGPPWSRAR